MGRFRLKHKLPAHGLALVHELRDLHTGRLLGRIHLWADQAAVLPDLVSEFLIQSQLVPEDFELELQTDQDLEGDGTLPAE